MLNQALSIQGTNPLTIPTEARQEKSMSIINVPRVEGIQPHCETALNNAKCPYIGRGCDGCVPDYIKRWGESFFDHLAEVRKRVEDRLFFEQAEKQEWPEQKQEPLDRIIIKEVIS